LDAAATDEAAERFFAASAALRGFHCAKNAQWGRDLASQADHFAGAK